MICRKIKDRPRDPAKWNEIADVVSALSIPVIANGDIFEYDDFRRIQDATGLLINNSFIFHFEESKSNVAQQSKIDHKNQVPHLQWLLEVLYGMLLFSLQKGNYLGKM